MYKELIYVEEINNSSHTGPAWIGFGLFNRTRKTIYFNGKILGKGRGMIGNFVDIQSGKEHWVSGVKKNGEDRHWAGHGKIFIDKSVISEYLQIIDEPDLPKNKFVIQEFDNEPKLSLSKKIENRKMNKNNI